MNPVLTADEVASLLKVTPAYIRKLARRQEIPVTRVGNRWRFTEDQLTALVAHLEQPALVPDGSLVGQRARRRVS